MARIRISTTTVIHDLGAEHDAERRFVITNEATGQHFSADRSTVRFIEGLRRHGQFSVAAAEAGIAHSHAATLVGKLAQRGIALGAGAEQGQAKPASPIEGKLISIKADLMDAAPLARRLSLLGRIAFSYPAMAVWIGLVLYAVATFLENTDKVATSLAQLGTLQSANLIGFVVLFVGVKLIHELGHILAFRTMSLREGLEPGPIRVGIMVFAATPFPFTDVTGAWRIASRWRRAMIGAGGIYFETFAVAALTLAWARLDLGSLEPIILQVAVFSGALTLLFNLNPAVKLDGYYILTDILGQANLAGRASQAARATFGRLLGADLPKAGRWELAYWIASYVYRWTIFAGIFWVAYRFDPRLAALIAAVSAMLLIVRPFWSTLRPLLPKITPMRLAIMTVSALVLLALCMVPFRARVLADGQMITLSTEYLRAPEASKLEGSGQGMQSPRFLQPQLDQDRQAINVRLAVLTNLSRQAGLNATELAALQNDRAGLEKRLQELETRAARLTPKIPNDAIISPLASERFDGQWIETSLEQPLAAVSIPAGVKVDLQMPQSRLDTLQSDTLDVRLVTAPECGFPARLTTRWADAVAVDGVLEVSAQPIGELPSCAREKRNGTAVVARFPLPPRSIAERLRRTVQRLLQERLPFETEL